MITNNGIIVKDPDILGGTPVFQGTRVPFQALLDYLEGGRLWMSSWMTSPPLPVPPQFPLWNSQSPCSSDNLDESPARRVRPSQIEKQPDGS